MPSDRRASAMADRAPHRATVVTYDAANSEPLRRERQQGQRVRRPSSSSGSRSSDRVSGPSSASRPCAHPARHRRRLRRDRRRSSRVATPERIWGSATDQLSVRSPVPVLDRLQSVPYLGDITETTTGCHNGPIQASLRRRSCKSAGRTSLPLNRRDTCPSRRNKRQSTCHSQ